MVLSFIYQITQPVTFRVQVWCIYLVNIAGEYEFAVLSCPADDCFNFMRRKVLRFIYNKKYFAQRTAADEGQRRYRDLLIGYQFINFSLHFFIIAKLIFNKLQVVPNWRHVRVDF